jgi:hypothetical protein
MQQVRENPQAHNDRDHSDGYSPIDIVLVSHAFERAPVLKGLLVYLWEHRGEDFSEYAIATGALGRRPDFDPKTNATVRVEISRLRQHLKEFYETEGAAIPARVRIPMGSHHLELFRAEAPTGGTRRGRLRGGPASWVWPSLLPAFICACGALIAVIAYLRIPATGAKVTSAGTSLPAKAPPLPHFWQSIVANGKPFRIIIPRPLFFALRPDLVVRDTNVNDSSGGKNSPNLKGLERGVGFPKVIQTYTVADDALGAQRLVSFLQTHDIPVTETTDADARADMPGHENLIAFGTSKTLSAFDQGIGLTPSLDFRLDPEAQLVENRRPTKGEPPRFPFRGDTEATSIWPGTLAVLPGKGPNTCLLLLKAFHTVGLANLLTSSPEFDQLEKMWEAQGSPRYFETVVNIEMNGNQYVLAWPVAMHVWQGPH